MLITQLGYILTQKKFACIVHFKFATGKLRIDLCGHRLEQPPNDGNECLFVTWNNL